MKTHYLSFLGTFLVVLIIVQVNSIKLSFNDRHTREEKSPINIFEFEREESEIDNSDSVESRSSEEDSSEEDISEESEEEQREENNATLTPFGYCGGVTQKIQVRSFQIAGCMSSPCKFNMGNKYSGSYTIVSASTLTAILLVLKGKANEWPYSKLGWQNIPLDNGNNVCSYGQGICPANPNVPDTFTTTISVPRPSEAPKHFTGVVQATIMASIQGAPYQLVSCIEFNVDVSK